MKNFSKSGVFFIIMGLCFLLAAIGLVIYNVNLSAGAAAANAQLTKALDAQLAARSASSADDPMLKRLNGSSDNIPTKKINGYELVGSITIPVINIDLAVISQWSYPNLEVGPCRYDGTPTNKLVILAHNFDTQFGRLKSLAVGDTVVFTSVTGEKYTYKVIRKETWSADQFKQILSGDDWDLTLFTCTYSGSSRVVIRCALADETS